MHLTNADEVRTNQNAKLWIQGGAFCQQTDARACLLETYQAISWMKVSDCMGGALEGGGGGGGGMNITYERLSR